MPVLNSCKVPELFIPFYSLPPALCKCGHSRSTGRQLKQSTFQALCSAQRAEHCKCCQLLFVFTGSVRKVNGLQTLALMRYTLVLGAHWDCQEGAFEGLIWEELDLNEKRGSGLATGRIPRVLSLLVWLFSVWHPLGHTKLQNIAVGLERDGQQDHILLRFKVVTRVKFVKVSLLPLRNV